MLKVAAFTGGLNEPSARFRLRQYIPILKEQNIEVTDFYSKMGKYPPENKLIRPLWAFATLSMRIPDIVKSYNYDITFLQREMLSTFTTFELLTKSPRVLDVDDAIFLYRFGKFAKRLAQLSELVICGNNFIAEWFSKWNKNIVVIPTAVDTHRYIPRKENHPSQCKLVLGWIGTSGNFKYLYRIESALERVIKAQPGIIFKIISDSKPIFKGKLSEKLEYVKWSPENEIVNIQNMTIGIMPLDNTEWEKGKCSFKMLQYMACGIPVVVSHVGMNSQVLSLGEAGIGAKSQEEWVEAILTLLSLNDIERKKIGMIGRRIVEEYFSIDMIAPRLAGHLRGLLV